MNERIKELAREAGLLVYNPEGAPTKLEKFAKLIVRECVGIVDDEGCGEGGSIRAMKKIKEHFGVEE